MMKKTQKTITGVLFIWTLVTTSYAQHTLKADETLLRTVNQRLQESANQYKHLMHHVPDEQLPRTYENGKLLSTGPYAWTSGFYPGTLLYLYEFSNDSALWQEASEKLAIMKQLQTVKVNHDLGFMMYCSFGNACRLKNDPHYKEILDMSARSLSSRFYPVAKSIKSWDKIKSLDGKRMLNFPVIIDNMMNLELLFFASRATGDPSFRNIAITHTETTINNHLRPDYSCYHVVNYDPGTGKVLSKETQQGFSDNSAWSRGQAWGIYGFTMVYRETKNKKYLRVAQKMADFFIHHPQLPVDKIPYWDFNVGQPGFNPVWNYDPARYREIPRDASAAAITASALIELAGHTGGKAGQRYLKAAEAMLESLSSPQYSSRDGENGGFILMHSSGGVPGNVEVDIPLSYADYYYIEALMRYRALSKR